VINYEERLEARNLAPQAHEFLSFICLPLFIYGTGKLVQRGRKLDQWNVRCFTHIVQTCYTDKWSKKRNKVSIIRTRKRGWQGRETDNKPWTVFMACAKYRTQLLLKLPPHLNRQCTETVK
jgi:hypothetical protein